MNYFLSYIKAYFNIYKYMIDSYLIHEVSIVDNFTELKKTLMNPQVKYF